MSSDGMTWDSSPLIALFPDFSVVYTQNLLELTEKISVFGLCSAYLR